MFDILPIMLIMFPASGAADPLASIRDLSDEGPIYAYDMVYEVDGLSASGSIDPTKPVGQRVEIVSPPREDWPDDFAEGVEEIDQNADGDIWCTDFAANVPDNATLTSEDDAVATYTFQPVPDEEADGAERKLFRALVGTVVVDKAAPGIRSFQMHLPEPMKPNFMAKINSFSMFATCERAPDGRMYVADFSFDIKGSALGQSFGETIQRKITRLFPPSSS